VHSALTCYQQDVRFPFVLLDLDHTLLDSDASELLAFEQALTMADVELPSQYFSPYRTINHALWAAVERGEMTAEQVKVERFAKLIASTGLNADARSLADAFSAGLGAYGGLFPGTRDVIERLVAQCTLGLITNGIGSTQRARIGRLRLAHYFQAIVISSEVGSAKPAADIFHIALRMLGDPPLSTVLMVGDSLTSDMQGGRNAGITTCWFNPRELPLTDPRVVDFQISELSQLEVLCGLAHGDKTAAIERY
jgi:2-haloacid dehalogenase